MTEEDIQTFLNIHRVASKDDPLHKWIGTYNVYLVHISRFFKWLHYLEYPGNERLEPKCIINLKRLLRKEKSIYKPTDLWSQEDYL